MRHSSFWYKLFSCSEIGFCFLELVKIEISVISLQCIGGAVNTDYYNNYRIYRVSEIITPFVFYRSVTEFLNQEMQQPGYHFCFFMLIKIQSPTLGPVI